MAPPDHPPDMYSITKMLGFGEVEGKNHPARTFRLAAMAYFDDRVINTNDDVISGKLEETAKQWKTAEHEKYLSKSQISLTRDERNRTQQPE